jgi:uncharacterized protein involved in exopolysaccharide biosynthesis
MENNYNQKPSQYNDVITIAELIQTISKWWKFLLSKWLIILIAGLIGGGLGILYSLYKKPKYTAKLSFAIVEGGSNFGLADLASSFGFGGLFGGNSDAFSGDNLLEIISSKKAVEQTLLTPVIYKGEQKTLADVFIQISGFRKKWNQEKKVPELKTLSYPVGQPRDSFTRVQDSIMNVFYQMVSSPKALTIARKSKKVSIVNLSFTHRNEFFAKNFVELLMDQTYQFYLETRTAQIRANVDMMQQKADSVKLLYEEALYKGAAVPQINVNPALRLASVPLLKQETNAQLYGTVYTEVLKNLEALKLDLARQTPIVQIIDKPRYPLYDNKLGKLKGLIFGGILGGIFIVGYIFLKEIIEISKKKIEN